MESSLTGRQTYTRAQTLRIDTNHYPPLLLAKLGRAPQQMDSN